MMRSSSSHKHVALNPEAPEYFPSTYTCYVFFVPHIYPLTLYNINNYQQSHLHHASPVQEPVSHEAAQSHQRRRFGGACSKNRFVERRVQLDGEKKGNLFKLERDKMGNKSNGEDGAGAAYSRVVQTCVMLNRRPKPVVPLRYGEENVDVTTVMIRNVPNKLTRSGLLALLDKHCMLMNEACKGCGDENHLSAYDFVYLPTDFRTGVNKGYAFVNFTNRRAVKKFHNAFHNKAWDGFKTPKICEIVRAKIQGKEELVKHFGGTLFICRCDEYLPVCFRPGRDGSAKAVEEVLVGQRSSHHLTQETDKKVWEGMQWKRSGRDSRGTQLQKSL